MPIVSRGEKCFSCGEALKPKEVYILEGSFLCQTCYQRRINPPEEGGNRGKKKRGKKSSAK
jgi:recombinational DNA repair protein (RecF pathway)